MTEQESESTASIRWVGLRPSMLGFKRVLVVDQILGEQVNVLALGVRNLDDELLDLEHPEVLGLLVLGHVEPAVEVVDQRLGLIEAEEQVVAFF